jgi:hypothetical protein
MRKSIFASAAVASTVATIVACSVGPGADDARTSALADSPPSRIGMLPPDDGIVSQLPPPSGAHLVDYGGPVLSHVKVFVIAWGAGPAVPLSSLSDFYAAVTDSSYFAWLREYDTPTQAIGTGTWRGAYRDTSAPTATSLGDPDIQNELSRLIDTGKVPAPDADSLYMIYFPPGVSIDAYGSFSCQQFCAYHDAYVHGGKNVYYGVMPDLGSGGCQSVCGTGTLLQNTTLVSSHELVESVTDPAVFARSYGYPLAWYDQQNGEIGDICAWHGYASVAGYRVQLEWSNEHGACIAGDGDDPLPSDGGADVDADAGDGGGGGGGGGPVPSCAVCTEGLAHARSCGACVQSICSVDPYCCTTAWDKQCVTEAPQICANVCH